MCSGGARSRPISRQRFDMRMPRSPWGCIASRRYSWWSAATLLLATSSTRTRSSASSWPHSSGTGAGAPPGPGGRATACGGRSGTAPGRAGAGASACSAAPRGVEGDGSVTARSPSSAAPWGGAAMPPRAPPSPARISSSRNWLLPNPDAGVSRLAELEERVGRHGREDVEGARGVVEDLRHPRHARGPARERRRVDRGEVPEAGGRAGPARHGHLVEPAALLLVEHVRRPEEARVELEARGRERGG